MGIKKEKTIKVLEKYEELLRFEMDSFEADITNQREAISGAKNLSEIVRRYNLIEDFIRSHGVKMDIIANNLLEELNKIKEDKTKGINFNPR